jgi:hypothetical protein
VFHKSIQLCDNSSLDDLDKSDGIAELDGVFVLSFLEEVHIELERFDRKVRDSIEALSRISSKVVLMVSLIDRQLMQAKQDSRDFSLAF